MLYSILRWQGKLGVRSQCRAVAAGHKQKSVLKPGFSLVCKLAVSNEFWEAALLQGCSLAAGHSHALLSTLPSQICPDVPSLSVAAPGGSVIARLACPLSLSGPKPAEPCKSLPLPSWWPQTGLTDRRPWMLGHQFTDIGFCWWYVTANAKLSKWQFWGFVLTFS